MTSAAHRGFGSVPVIQVRLGRLSIEDVGTFRDVMTDFAAVPVVRVVVDLSDLDEQHETTVFAILVSAARGLQRRGSSLELIGAGETTQRWLSEAPVVTALEHGNPVPDGTRTLHIGRLPPRPTAR